MAPLKNLLHPRLSNLIAFRDGELSGRQARRVENHLAQCRRCRNECGRIAAETQAFAMAGSCLPQLDLARGVSDVLSRIAARQEMANDARAEAAVRERLREQLQIFFGAGAAKLADPAGSPDSDVLRKADRLFTAFLGRPAAEMVLDEIRNGGRPRHLEDMSRHHAV